MTGAAVIAISSGAQLTSADKSDTVQPRWSWPRTTRRPPAACPTPNWRPACRRWKTRLAAQNDRATADRTRLSTLEQGYNSAVWTFDNGRATFASGDGRFTLAIRARMQADFAGFMQDSDPSRRLRRSRPICPAAP